MALKESLEKLLKPLLEQKQLKETLDIIGGVLLECNRKQMFMIGEVVSRTLEELKTKYGCKCDYESEFVMSSEITKDFCDALNESYKRLLGVIEEVLDNLVKS